MLTQATEAQPAPDVDSEALPFREAYERLEPRILAVPRSECHRVDIEVGLAVRRILTAVPDIMLHRDSAARLPDFDITTFDDLESIALALGHAHTRYLAVTTDQARIPPRGRRVRELRDKLRKDIAALTERGLLPPQARRSPTRNRGHDRATYELLGLVEHLRDHWPNIEGRSAITREDLDEAESAAGKLGWAVTHRKAGTEHRRAATQAREQALALLKRTYKQVRRAIRYLRDDFDDADLIAPPLYQGQRQRLPKAAAEPAAE
jgi:hypothetical protein